MALLHKATRAAAAVWLVVLSGVVQAQSDASPNWQAEVFAAERAFARSMADRDFAAFGRHVAADAVFFGNAMVQRGRDAVLGAWRPFFDGAQAPFSWCAQHGRTLAGASPVVS